MEMKNGGQLPFHPLLATIPVCSWTFMGYASALKQVHPSSVYSCMHQQVKNECYVTRRCLGGTPNDHLSLLVFQMYIYIHASFRIQLMPISSECE